MPLNSPRLPFTHVALGRVPERPGVFVLWSGPTPVHVGRTMSEDDGLHMAIRRHLNGAATPSLPQVTHFSYETAPDPASRHFDLVLEMNWSRSSPPGGRRPPKSP